jgi:hypothetical protein
VEDSFEYENTVAPEIKTLDAGWRNACAKRSGLLGLSACAVTPHRFPRGCPGATLGSGDHRQSLLSPDAGFAAALEHAGIPYSEASDNILHDALNP